MTWLFLSILCSTLIFIVFKLFARFHISNLQAIVVNYFVAFFTGFWMFPFAINPVEIIEKPWFSSILILGALFISLFQLMAFVSQKFGVAAVSVAVKMSLVIPVIFAMWRYGENLGFLKVMGIVAALVAVWLATRKPGKTQGDLKLAIVPLVLFVGSGFLDAFLKYNQQELLPPADKARFTSLIFLTAGIIGIFWFAAKCKWGNERPPQWRALLGGLALGIPNYGSIYFLLKALEMRDLESSAIFPINNVGVVALSTLCGFLLFNEKLSPKNRLGILLAMVSIGLIAFHKLF